MSVYIACEQCQKRLKIPEEVVGHSIKCPSCGGVFKSDPAKVLPIEAAPVVAVVEEDEAAAPAPQKGAARHDEDEGLPRPRKKAAMLDDDEDAVIPAIPAKKKAVVVDDEDEGRPRKKKAAPVAEDEEEVPARPRRRRAADEDEEEDDEGDRPKKGKPRTPWYVMLPLLLLSFTAIGLAWLWAIGVTWLGIDRDMMNVQFESRMWIGIATGVGVTLLCLVCSLLPVRAWLRFLLVLVLLALGYGGSLAAVHWWKELPIKEEKPAEPFPPPRPGGPGPAGGRGIPGGRQGGPAQ